MRIINMLSVCDIEAEPLRQVEAEFRGLVEREVPLALETGGLAEGLPAEAVDVVRLRSLLLHPSLGYPERAAVWGRLIELTREPGELGAQWRLAAVGMVAWGLRRIAGRVCRELPEHNADLQQVILEAAWQALLKAQDTPAGEAGKIASRIVWAADRAARAYVKGEAARAAHTDMLGEPHTAARQPIHPDALLTLAVRQGVLSTSEAALVGDYRLGGISTRTLAEQAGVSPQAVDKRRQRAERALTSAITSGRLAFTEIEHLIER
ncbi:hypothetical protein ABIA33_001377 [Streptacidiphilus sp. MAP12-16]|uniref:hypothetical protein n=1 Tax=Streptacidiphilus sp. MAP12-16 TaxID=3156300 RepID=UPI003516A589